MLFSNDKHDLDDRTETELMIVDILKKIMETIREHNNSIAFLTEKCADNAANIIRLADIMHANCNLEPTVGDLLVSLDNEGIDVDNMPISDFLGYLLSGDENEDDDE